MNSSVFLSVATLLVSSDPLGHNWNHLWIRWNSGILASSQNSVACYFLCFFPLARKTVTSALVSPLSLFFFPFPEGPSEEGVSHFQFCMHQLTADLEFSLRQMGRTCKSKSNSYFPHVALMSRFTLRFMSLSLVWKVATCKLSVQLRSNVTNLPSICV